MSKEKLSISEMAKLRGISVDTLRYYDKIDLFKPSQVALQAGLQEIGYHPAKTP
ncbi:MULTISPECIES: MerR family DNA-binding transcriptional regulator [Paenibacillus]|uniref:Transcriptional regulator n=1 Tax=Paenibacillus brasilensis TaxID=128574 RepID=A0ABU0L0C8_9BACL|nr:MULTISPECIES: MerR family DNA-binding transcriptional regulator [Paenibacillus]MDQ0495142.1 putative transcriptional regulator [Paenibacillus brasilensis]